MCIRDSFGDNVVLRDIDLDVHKGEVVVVLGPSGSVSYTHLDVYKRQPLCFALSGR